MPKKDDSGTSLTEGAGVSVSVPASTASHDALNGRATREVAYHFVRYYVEGTGGCRNCGGVPHSDTCFVGRFIVAMAHDSIGQRVRDAAPELLEALKALYAVTWEITDTDEFRRTLGTAHQQVIDAIKKAEGR